MNRHLKFSIFTSWMIAFSSCLAIANPPTAQKPKTPATSADNNIEEIRATDLKPVYDDLAQNGDRLINGVCPSEYKDKTFDITGIIAYKNTNEYNGPISGEKNGTEIGLMTDSSFELTCKIPGKFKPLIMKIKEGQGVKIRGTFKRVNGNAILVFAKNIEMSGPNVSNKPAQTAPIAISADALSQEFTPNWIDAMNKWKGQIVEITGNCLFTGGEPVGTINQIFLMDTTNKHFGIICEMPAKCMKVIHTIKELQAVKIVGAISTFQSGAIIIKGDSITKIDQSAITKTMVSSSDDGSTATAGETDPINNELEKADSAFSRNDFDTALSIWQSLANKGNSVAQYHLGYMYFEGKGIRKDPSMAVKWFRNAAEQGNVDSQLNLGIIYASGIRMMPPFGPVIVPKDSKESLKWYRKAADQGNEDAKKALAQMGQ